MSVVKLFIKRKIEFSTKNQKRIYLYLDFLNNGTISHLYSNQIVIF